MKTVETKQQAMRMRRIAQTDFSKLKQQEIATLWALKELREVDDIQSVWRLRGMGMIDSDSKLTPRGELVLIYGEHRF